MGRNVSPTDPSSASARYGASPLGGLWFTTVPSPILADQASHFNHSLWKVTLVRCVLNGRPLKNSKACSLPATSFVSRRSLTSKEAWSERSSRRPWGSQSKDVVNVGPNL